MTEAVKSTDFKFPGLKHLYHGKVRDVYNINDEYMVMVVTDRISAFDVVLPKGIPFKGQVLNQVAAKFLDATADIVPLACLNAYELMKERKVKSLLINTVHDSIVVDVYPGEEKIMSDILSQSTRGVKNTMKSMYNIDFNVPLDIEVKIGDDWLDMTEINV